MEWFECIVFFFKQKTAYEIYQCDWSSDVCSSDLATINTVHEAKELFSLLRFIFWQEPTLELLDNFLQVEIIEEEVDIDRGLNMMHNAVVGHKTSLDEYSEELAIEFTRLFIGPQNRLPCPLPRFIFPKLNS